MGQDQAGRIGRQGRDHKYLWGGAPKFPDHDGKRRDPGGWFLSPRGVQNGTSSVSGVFQGPGTGKVKEEGNKKKGWGLGQSCQGRRGTKGKGAASKTRRGEGGQKCRRKIQRVGSQCPKPQAAGLEFSGEKGKGKPLGSVGDMNGKMID